ncbi:transcription repressor NadR [Salipaludibacillus keqinensis]|uniref:Transcription repressor NadR n=1 Tax=Salipaludibacillus keqinensis TaxID=2045207 RepID=A0A323TGX7_9BACI|nr:transcription repressor NadR [Salipaludibacillus keqinensis]PYZ94078.1 transcription repressor NadR [Salipaludibacillus keqinensis]
MRNKKKWFGDERRSEIILLLTNHEEPLTGGQLAEHLNVSRQVIVQDISLLKAKNIPIMATSQGYVMKDANPLNEPFSRIVACHHKPEQTEEELLILVDQGVRVKDVKVEHPIYGDITASIMVNNRKEVFQFIRKVQQTKASYLSELTDGVHLHTIEALSERDLDDAVQALHEAGFLLTDETRH